MYVKKGYQNDLLLKTSLWNLIGAKAKRCITDLVCIYFTSYYVMLMQLFVVIDINTSEQVFNKAIYYKT